MFKFILPIFFLLLLSCGETECDCVLPQKISNFYKVSITQKSKFKIGKDTIWINGFVSTKVYDEAIKDSIFSEEYIKDVFSIYKLVSPTDNYNCVDGLDKFKLVDKSNGIEFFESCKNSTVSKNTILSPDGFFFEYRLGFVPKFSGDFMISFQKSIILNTNKNTNIIEKYSIKEMTDKIGFNSCGQLSWRELKDSEKEYYFNVTNE